MQITIPRWVQLILIPLAVLAVFYLLRTLSTAVFVFLMASLLSLLLNPLVQSLCALRIPRILAVPIVYLSFATIVVLLSILAGPPLAAQLRALVENVPEWASQVESWLTDLQAYLAERSVDVNLTASVDRLVVWVEDTALSTAGTVFNVTFNVLSSLATFLLIVIISFYMLFDGRRIFNWLKHILPGDDETMAAYLFGLQQSFVRYVKGQFLLALAVGLAGGIAIWSLGWQAIDIWPEGSRYALLFGVWAGVTEVIPFIGPWLGATPPVLLALFHSPGTALWVAFIYFAIQQLENHILVPNIMGTTVGVHPLVVIFAILAGAQVGGIVGMLAVLPLLAMGKHTIDFFDFRFSRAPWIADDGVPLRLERGSPREPEVVLPAMTVKQEHGAVPSHEQADLPERPPEARERERRADPIERRSS